MEQSPFHERNQTKPNPYESTSTDSVGLKPNSILYWLALAASFLFCAVPAGVAVYAWVTHWHWQHTGAYARNSFPMNKLASDATSVAIGCVAVTVCVWVAWTITIRKRQP